MIETIDGRVLVQTDDGSAWCARHWTFIVPGADGCYWSEEPYKSVSEDPGRCQPVPLYVEAPDP